MIWLNQDFLYSAFRESQSQNEYVNEDEKGPRWRRTKDKDDQDDEGPASESMQVGVA